MKSSQSICRLISFLFNNKRRSVEEEEEGSEELRRSMVSISVWRAVHSLSLTHGIGCVNAMRQEEEVEEEEDVQSRANENEIIDD